MIDDFTKSVKASLYDRATSPLFGALASSWLAWNHRMVFVLFSSIPVGEKFEYIDSQLYGGSNAWLLLIVYPLITALVALFLYPFPARWVFRFWRTQQRIQTSIKQQIENETLLSLEQSKKIRKESAELTADYENQLRRRSDDMERLKEALTSSQEERDRLKEEISQAQSRAGGSTVRREALSEAGIASYLIGGRFRLFYTPERGLVGSKIMTFANKGEIVDGKNENENSWRIQDNKLELLQKSGVVHSRFEYLPETGIFLHSHDPSTKTQSRAQYMIPAQ